MTKHRIALMLLASTSFAAAWSTSVRSDTGSMQIAEKDVETGSMVLASPDDLCLVPLSLNDGVPTNKIMFPLDQFKSARAAEGTPAALVTRTKNGARVEVIVDPDTANTRSAVSQMSAFIAAPKAACSDPSHSVEVEFGVKGLSIEYENGVAVDFNFRPASD